MPPAERAPLADALVFGREELEAALDSAERALAALQVKPARGRRAASAEALDPRDLENAKLKEQLGILRQAIERVSFRPLRGGVRTAAQAAYILGMPSEWGLDEATINARYRLLAPIYHPDGAQLADAERMAQLIEARNLLLRHLKHS
jgi:hypothetical protein